MMPASLQAFGELLSIGANAPVRDARAHDVMTSVRIHFDVCIPGVSAHKVYTCTMSRLLLHHVSGPDTDEYGPVCRPPCYTGQRQLALESCNCIRACLGEVPACRSSTVVLTYSMNSALRTRTASLCLSPLGMRTCGFCLASGIALAGRLRAARAPPTRAHRCADMQQHAIIVAVQQLPEQMSFSDRVPGLANVRVATIHEHRSFHQSSSLFT